MRNIDPAALAPFALTAFASLCLAGTSAAQYSRIHPRFLDTTIPGFSIYETRPVGVFDAYATLRNGDRVVFDGLSIDLVADDGTPLLHLGGTAQFSFPSFVLPDPTETFALVGESSTDQVLKVDLGGAGQSLLASVYFAYDATWEDAGHVLLSAACSTGCGTEIDRLDVQTGALQLVATVPESSGPLVRDADGDLYYGLQPPFPGGPGDWSILRWTATQVAGGSLLDESDATVFASGFDGAADLAFDDVYGHLLLAESFYDFFTDVGWARVVELDRQGQMVARVIESANQISNLELFQGPGPGSFQAFQPTDGVTMKYRSTDYDRGRSDVVTVRPRRPQATTSGPGLNGPGLVTFRVRGAEPFADFQVLSGPVSSYNPNEIAYDLGNFLFHTGIPRSDIRRLGFAPTDQHGEGTWTFQNPGGLEGTFVFQALIRSSGGTFIGSSTAAFN